MQCTDLLLSPLEASFEFMESSLFLIVIVVRFDQASGQDQQNIPVHLARDRQVLPHEPFECCLAQRQNRRSLMRPDRGGSWLAGEHAHFTHRRHRIDLGKIDTILGHNRQPATEQDMKSITCLSHPAQDGTGVQVPNLTGLHDTRRILSAHVREHGNLFDNLQ